MTARRGDQTAYQEFVMRILAAYARRCADADPEDLTELLALQQVLDEAVTVAVRGLRVRGCSWSHIARCAGISKQAAQQRWGVKPRLTTEVAG